jgi:hypothetical protein
MSSKNASGGTHPGDLNDARPNATPLDSSSLGSEYTERDLGLLPIPRRLRYNPKRPFYFGLWMQILFMLSSTFTVSNLFWCQPILSELSKLTSYEDCTDRTSTKSNCPILLASRTAKYQCMSKNCPELCF